MNLQYYRNFLTVVETGSLTGAAEKTLIAQPALSRQIQVLEEAFGTKLVKMGRGRHRIQLTEAGWIFYRRARQLCQLEDATYREITDCGKGLSGTLTFSMSASRVPNFVSRYAVPFTRKYPGISYDIRETHHLRLLDDVLKGVSEIGISNAILPDRTCFDILFTRPEHFFLLGRPDNPWLNLEKPLDSLRDLAEIPLVMGRSYQGLLMSACAEEGTSPRCLATVDTAGTSMRFAEMGLALAIVPLEPFEKAPQGLRMVELGNHRLMIEKALFKLRGRTLSSAMQRFIEVYREEIERLFGQEGGCNRPSPQEMRAERASR